MSNTFRTCLMTRGKGSSPDFSIVEVNLKPHQGIECNNPDEILLAGGFSTVVPDGGFPLSPTLQLNHDLGTFSKAQLKTIAQAELCKQNSMSYRSYSVEPDSRLSVIARDGVQMQAFVESYGGILDIEPLVISGYHREFPTADELAIYADKAGYRLNYSARVPVDTDICTYCGACGSACPESCINEDLSVDFSSCTFCMACEGACTAGAIDINAIEERVMRVPTILLLDGVEVELPDNAAAIYRENELPAFFATQFACQVDEVVTCNSDLCQYSAKFGYGCRSCLDACKYGAIKAGRQGIRIDALKCEECGACVGGCPTGAMQYERCNDAMFIEYVSSLDIKPGTTVILGNEQTLHQLWWHQKNTQYKATLFLEYPEIGALSLVHLLYLYTSGAGRIVLLADDDQTIEITSQVALAASLLNTYCQIPEAVIICSLQGFIKQPIEAKEWGLSSVHEAKGQGNRRRNLADVLQFLSEQSGRQVRVKAGQVPFATLNCDQDLCTHCLACLNGCRVGALGTTEDKLALTFRPALCVGCGICQRVCPEQALKLESGATLDAGFFQRETVAKAEGMACKKCGKVFGSKKSFDRVMEILSSRETVDTSHFEFCETCRVVKLFETA